MKLHFIGIGGIGISALAQYYLKKGHYVSGSDLVSSEITKALEGLGVKIIINSNLKFQISKIKEADVVIYSPAVPVNHPEIKLAKKLKIKCQSYPQALGELTKEYFTIAVCGSHGKSTIAAMIGLILTKAKLDPTVILGTKLKEFNDSNCRVGKSKYLVIEADEYKESFLNYWPKIIVLSNIEYDHPDYFKTPQDYILAFEKFVSHLFSDGILVANGDDKNISKLKSQISKIKTKILKPQFKIQNYSLKEKESEKLKKILKIPGEFNVLNALAALIVARILRIPDKTTFKVFSQFKGTWRRFDEYSLKIKNLKLKIINDYGHHPTQLKVTLEAAKEKYKNKKIWCIFQPHQYQRTYYFFNDFVKVLKKNQIDKVIITDIYTVLGREKKEIMKKVNSQKLVKKVNKKNVIYLPKEKIIKHLKENLTGGEVVIIMGAGDIYEILDKK